MKKLITSLIVLTIIATGCTNNSSENGSAIKIHETPVSTVTSFFNEIESGEYQKAYDRQKVESWSNYDKFTSSNGYAGITNIEIFKIKLIEQTDSSALVYMHYFAEDSENKDGFYKQNFNLIKDGENWFIKKSTVINRRRITTTGYSDVDYANNNTSIKATINKTKEIDMFLEMDSDKIEISESMFEELVANGVIETDDILNMNINNNNPNNNNLIVLKSFKLGEFKLENIPATINEKAIQSLVVGENLLRKYNRNTTTSEEEELIAIDNNNTSTKSM